MPVNYALAKDILSEVEKNRMLCCYLNSTNMNDVDWKKAANEFGSASEASFRKMVQTAWKKVKEADENGRVLPSSAKKNAGGKKRKADADADADGDDEEAKMTPAKKRGVKKGGKKVKQEEASPDPELDDDGATNGVEVDNGDED